jgi:outer membrane protein OmpU
LCGSLAAISAANAGDLTVTGGADLTWVSLSKQVTGNPIGMGSNFGLAGSGELENGWSVDLSIAMTNANAYSNASVTIGIPGLGDFLINQGGSGTGIDRMDDMTPTVWEEADGAGLSAGITSVAGTSGGATIEFKPEATPEGLTLRAAYSPNADDEPASDKAGGGDSGTLKNGWDLTLEASDALHGLSGLTLYAGMSQVDQFQNATTINGDAKERVFGAKYAVGNFTVGWQDSSDEVGTTSNNTYDNTAYSITFSINDDLSIGYGHVESAKEGDNTAEADSLQVAYTMGGASIRIAEVDVENQSYSTAATADLDATIVSLSLAF